jgi:dynein heavy chain 1
VLDLQKQLAVFEKDLHQKDKEANEKLKQMV